MILEEQWGDQLSACNLSLVGKFLFLKPINYCAAKETIRAIWRMGRSLRIVEVGNDLLQFQFPTEFQLQWVLDNGPWAFDNNLLVLCRWDKGMNAFSVTLTHAQFWVQVWGLPFDLMTLKIRTLVRNSMGRCLQVDGRIEQSEQARFLCVKVELPLYKPLRRGGSFYQSRGRAILGGLSI